MMRVVVTCAVALAIAFSASTALAAPAANRPDPRLDAAASRVAGHPVSVFCEDNLSDWTTSAWGYTYPPPYSSTINVSPWICGTLHSILDGEQGLAMNAVAAAIHTLVHESVHQRGGIYADCYLNGPDDMGCEGRTDCMALTLDVAVAVDFFGFARDVSTPVAATYKWVWRTVHGKRKRVRVVRTIASVLVSENPELTMFRWYTQAIHNGLPAQYQGDCST